MKMTPTIFRQSTPYTCGPACVIMALDCLKGIEPVRARETEIWEQARTNRGNFAYTTHPKLAMYLMGCGTFDMELWHRHKQGFIHHPSMPYWEFYRRMKYYDAFRAEAEGRGLKTRIFDYSAQDIAERVREPGTAAIVLTRIGGLTTVFHHRLVYDFDGTHLSVACPLEGAFEVTLEEFEQLHTLAFGRGTLLIRNASDPPGGSVDSTT